MSSAAEALAVAQERLRAALADTRPGPRHRGYYPRVPLREPILDELLIDGEQAVVVTRNRYGAEVLNTDRVLIADVDLPELERPSERDGWRLFRRTPRPDTTGPEPEVVVHRLATLAEWAAANPGLGVVAYRTASGLRVFVTGVAEPATSAEGERILAELGTDPVYRGLCRMYGSFRARLTPKPWRLPRTRASIDVFPYRNERRFGRWLAAYERAAAGYAVCRRLAQHGPAPSALEAGIIRRHDERTRTAAALPLA